MVIINGNGNDNDNGNDNNKNKKKTTETIAGKVISWLLYAVIALILIAIGKWLIFKII